MQRKLIVSSSPHLRDSEASTRGIMLDVCLALVPTAIAAVLLFGVRAGILILVSVFTAVFSEWFYERHTGRASTVYDLSAVVTGLLVAFNIPATAPWWVAAFGSLIAIILVKQLFGGIGSNFINPALIARTIMMLSWTSLMTASVVPQFGKLLIGLDPNVADVVTSATPLAADAQGYTFMQLFSGMVPGMLGETCKLTLILGGIYLMVRKVISWHIPVSFIGTVFILYLISTGAVYSAESGANNAVYQVMSGGLILGAFFMATDYVTSPTSKPGKLIMGVGCGVLLYVIRVYNASYPEGCSFAILFMNVLTPLIDKLTYPRSFGTKKTKRIKAKSEEGMQG